MGRNTIRRRFLTEFCPVVGGFQTMGSAKAGEAAAAEAARNMNSIVIGEGTTPQIRVVHETNVLPALIGSPL